MLNNMRQRLLIWMKMTPLLPFHAEISKLLKLARKKSPSAVKICPFLTKKWAILILVRENWFCPIMLKNGPIFPIFVLFALFLPKYQKKIQTTINLRLFWLVLSLTKFYLKVRFWNFEYNLQLMETCSGQNCSFFVISACKCTRGAIFNQINYSFYAS